MANPEENFKEYIKDAEEKAGKADALKDIINNAFQKVMDINKSSEQLSALTKKVLLFVKMIQSYISGDYQNIPLRTIVTIVASLLYFINPFDIIPDMIPGMGLLDDLAILMWVAGNVDKDIKDYEEFLKGNVEIKDPKP
ncbi:MAG TPA: YkvA family protein [Cyclobacteriaceae bacterium]|nr:YkvA family protein [Cyclobacteriaceae bacterium]